MMRMESIKKFLFVLSGYVSIEATQAPPRDFQSHEKSRFVFPFAAKSGLWSGL